MSQSQVNQKVERKNKYKQLIEKGTKVGETLENQHVLDTFKHIMEIIEICDNVSTDFARDARVENTADYIMDASIIKMSHDLMCNTTDKIVKTEFQEDEYINSLVDLMSPNQNEADKLMDFAIQCCKFTDIQLSMLGTFDFDAAPKPEKVKKVSQRARNKTLEPKSAPENVGQIVKQDKGAEKINIMRLEIQRVCRERKTDCLPYFEVIANPRSFMKSIDAAFQISFLIRDGILGFKRIDDEPYVFLYDPDPQSNHNRRQNAEETVQTVMSFTPQLWKEEIKKYNLKAPLLKLESATSAQTNDESSESSDSDSD